jgi:hypothetical protein
MIRRAGRHQGDAEPLEVVVASELHREVARETVRTLDQDRAHAVAGDGRQHDIGTPPFSAPDRTEPRAVGDRVGTAHGVVVVPADDIIAVGLGVALDGVPLAPLAVLVGADVGGRRGAHVAVCWQ